jgi:hypothetical protein
MLESRQHQPSLGPGRLVLEDGPKVVGVKGKPEENDRVTIRRHSQVLTVELASQSYDC